MKFVRNGWRGKSFFRQDRRRYGDGLRESAKPSAPISPPAISARRRPGIPLNCDSEKTRSSDGEWRYARSASDAIRAGLPDGREGCGHETPRSAFFRITQQSRTQRSGYNKL